MSISIYDLLESQLIGLYSTAISICHIDMYLGTIYNTDWIDSNGWSCKFSLVQWSLPQ